VTDNDGQVMFVLLRQGTEDVLLLKFELQKCSLLFQIELIAPQLCHISVASGEIYDFDLIRQSIQTRSNILFINKFIKLSLDLDSTSLYI
jgi:hypothetical protein